MFNIYNIICQITVFFSSWLVRRNICFYKHTSKNGGKERAPLLRTHHRISQRINAAEHRVSCEGQSGTREASKPAWTTQWDSGLGAELSSRGWTKPSNTKPKETSQKSQNPLWLKQVVTFSFTIFWFFKIIYISSLRILYNEFWSYSPFPNSSQLHCLSPTHTNLCPLVKPISSSFYRVYFQH